MISIAGNARLSKEQSFRFSSCFSRHISWCSHRLLEQKRVVPRREPLWGVTTEDRIMSSTAPDSKVKVLRTLRPQYEKFLSGSEREVFLRRALAESGGFVTGS